MNVVQLIAMRSTVGKPMTTQVYIRSDQVTREMRMMYDHLTTLPPRHPFILQSLLVMSMVDPYAFYGHPLLAWRGEIEDTFANFEYRFDVGVCGYRVNWKGVAAIMPKKAGPVIIDLTYVFYLSSNL